MLFWAICVGTCSILYCNCVERMASTQLSIIDATNNGVEVVRAEEGISYNAADKLAIIPETTQDELEGLVSYMEKHPAKVLILTGSFTQTESTKSNEQYLGLERAESFRESLVQMGIPTRQIAIMEQAKEQDELYEKNGFVYGALDYSFKNRFLSVEDVKNKKRWSVNVKDNLVFSFSDFTTQVSPNVQDGLEQIANYLQRNSDRVLTLTGLYSSKEENSSVFNDLGLARANTVKNILLSLDVSPKQLKVMGAQDKELDMFDSAIIGGVNFEFSGMSAEEDKETLKELERNLKSQNTRIYFETGSDEIKLTSELRSYFTDLTYYFSLNDDAKIQVVGHTDNEGSSRDNLKLGKRRAEFVRDYLASNGIATNRIEVSSRGDKDPIESNSTKEGRAANRRVEVKVK